MIRSYWKLHFSEQYNGKKGYEFKECMSWYRIGGSSVCAHRILHWMKALVMSIWGLCTTEGEFRVQVPTSPIGGLNHTEVCMIGAAGEWDCSNAYIRLREPDKSEDKVEQANVAIKKAKENKINVNPATRWWRACMRVVVYLSIDQGKLLRKHRRVEAVRGVVPFLLRGVDDKDDGEDGTIPKATKTIKDLLQVGVKFYFFRAKLLIFRKFDGRKKRIIVANSTQGVQILCLQKCKQRAGVY
ncbi:hypothetical protein B296_00044066 [Ensete ventricosum]|uniref:Uncharacterized protein n=1 Tax=Ensete ventricosum TaxID=4639 RepID=A0A426X9Z4_ENSVE|nr:hypothetical protein B296_00044066 [Ensete ventricosum]